MQETFQKKNPLHFVIRPIQTIRTEGNSKVSNLGACELAVLILERKGLVLCFSLRDDLFSPANEAGSKDRSLCNIHVLNTFIVTVWRLRLIQFLLA